MSFSLGLVAIAFSASPLFQTAGAEPPPSVVIDKAEYVVADTMQPPGDAAPWQPVTLPDDWNKSRPGFTGSVWYRLRFDVPNPRVHLVSLQPRLSGRISRYFVNGYFLGMSTAQADPRAPELYLPFVRALIPSVLRAGENTLHIRVTGNADYRHGLTTVAVGPGLEMIARQRLRHSLQVTAVTLFGATLLFAGLVSLAVWRGGGREPVLLWFGITALAWSAWALEFGWPLALSQPQLQNLLLFLVKYLYVPPLLVLCLRIAGQVKRGIEATLWAALAIGCIAASVLPVNRFPALMTGAWTLSLLLQAGFLGFLILRWGPGRRWTAYLLALAVLVLVLLNAHDWGRWMGWVDYENFLLGPYATPFLLLALGAAVVTQHLEAVRALARTNEMLEQRVEEKVKEAQAAHARMNEVLREQAVLRERQRIMTDMHDGIGSDLVGLLGAVQEPNADSTDVARRLSQVLADLRAIVDSLEPVEGDLGVVIGNIRYRMRAAIERSGIRLAWKVDPQLVMPDLTPARILVIQRIVMEALSNALQHSGAANLTVSARRDAGSGRVVILVEDDGRGYDTATVRAGRGLRNMHARAQAAGIELRVDSAPGKGTRVGLVLPVAGEAPAKSA